MASEKEGFVLVDEVNGQAFGLFDSIEAARTAALTGDERVGSVPWGEDGWVVQSWEDFADSNADSHDYTSIDGSPHDDAEAELIQAAEDQISMAQYQALHNRIEDYTTWLIESGFMAPNAIAGPNPSSARSDYSEFIFEHVEAYLDQVGEHEPFTALHQILRPDLSEFVDTVEDSIGRERPQF